MSENEMDKKTRCLGDNCIQIVIWGGKSAVLRSEISFYGDASAEP